MQLTHLLFAGVSVCMAFKKSKKGIEHRKSTH